MRVKLLIFGIIILSYRYLKLMIVDRKHHIYQSSPLPHFFNYYHYDDFLNVKYLHKIVTTITEQVRIGTSQTMTFNTLTI